MKRILSIAGSLVLAILFLSSFSLRENPQDPPRGKKGEKHIKIVKVDENGKKMELDTIIEGDNVFVFNGDTISGSKEMKWVSNEDFDMDFDMDFDIDVEETADGKVIIMRSDKDGKTMVKEIKIDMDGLEEDMEMMMLHVPEIAGMPHPPHPPRAMFIQNQSKKNVIDLSDPGIISYNKKKMKNGTEKITIVRKQVPEEDIELNQEIFIHEDGDHSMMIHESHPGKSKQIKIIKDDNGNVEIIENGKLMHIKEGSGNGTFITEEGDVFHIKESMVGDKKKFEVKVEVEKEEK
jgi:hypothetical protein